MNYVIVFKDNNEAALVKGVESEKEALDVYDRIVGDFRGRAFKIIPVTNTINLELGDEAWLN